MAIVNDRERRGDGGVVTSRRDSSAACPGASRKDRDAGHFAQNDGEWMVARGVMIGRRIAVRWMAKWDL